MRGSRGSLNALDRHGISWIASSGRGNLTEEDANEAKRVKRSGWYTITSGRSDRGDSAPLLEMSYSRRPTTRWRSTLGACGSQTLAGKI
ncbi:hypothetical protein Nepgr_002045 [Nepenthes gracilis]|uniref:Uncharacterized protein n=1 Tax=Nepenthes gracilis TaxID=150966 RepID=A0AAD3P5K5_NEPGR|nr:hypothetical protein Nepgr_002045 [Nepenthes gracilis]